jgi:hypothetical protein
LAISAHAGAAQGDRTVVATSLHEKLIKSSHRRYVTVQMSEAVVPRQMFVESCR